MKTQIIPVICSIALSAMIAAATSHWWSLHQFSVAINSNSPSTGNLTSMLAINLGTQLPVAPEKTQRPVKSASPTVADESHQKDFYEALIRKMASVENQNRDLLDQLAETNRDLMKLEFRVDTHSESFRPLPVREDKPFSSLHSEDEGVLPPRAEPVPDSGRN